QPRDPSRGLVWREIVENLERPGFTGTYISVSDVQRKVFSHHPWSLAGGGAGNLATLLSNLPHKLGERDVVIGRTTHTGLDDAFYRPIQMAPRLPDGWFVPVVLGDEVRDFRIDPQNVTL